MDKIMTFNKNGKNNFNHNFNNNDFNKSNDEYKEMNASSEQMKYKRLIEGLIKVGNNKPNFIDFNSMYLLAHVIYIGINDDKLRYELNQAYIKLMDDSRLLGFTLTDILIECISNGKYKNVMPAILIEYWDNFILTIEYFINPSPDMEEHIPLHIIHRAEKNAKNLLESELYNTH